ncbi:hypothetical protein D3C81_2232030 [compost metagenome]
MIDLTNGVDISAHGIETAVSVVPPTFIDIRDSSVEYAPNFPNMIYTLWGSSVLTEGFLRKLNIHCIS